MRSSAVTSSAWSSPTSSCELSPFGIGNPAPNLLVPGAQLTDPRPMGEGKHLRFTVRAGGVQARAVAFGCTTLPAGAEDGLPVTFRLERNEWQGTVEPRLVLRQAVTGRAPGHVTILGEAAGWEEAVLAAFATADVPLAPEPIALPAGTDPWLTAAGPDARDRRGSGIAGVLGALTASSDRVLVVACDAGVRAPQLAALADAVSLVGWPVLEGDPAAAASFRHLVVLDPPADPVLLARVKRACPDTVAHLAWGVDELGFTQHVHAVLHTLRDPLAQVYRALRSGVDPVTALRGDGPRPRHPLLAARLLRVLDEAGLATVDAATLRVSLKTVDGRVDLGRSATHRQCSDRLAQGNRWLSTARPRAA